MGRLICKTSILKMALVKDTKCIMLNFFKNNQKKCLCFKNKKKGKHVWFLAFHSYFYSICIILQIFSTKTPSLERKMRIHLYISPHSIACTNWNFKAFHRSIYCKRIWWYNKTLWIASGGPSFDNVDLFVTRFTYLNVYMDKFTLSY